MAGNSILAKMAVEISANNAKFASALNKSQRDLSAFTSNVTKVAGALGVAFSIHQIADFALEVSRLSGEAKAVRAAFERLPESTKLMQDLKRATGGTVSELDLMKRTVQASNFDISLKALPRLLEFATLRAQQTGQSVDYLVDSIVTGIGRKSKLILDNLGISAVQLTEALGGASAASSSIGDVAEAVGKIAEDNLKNMETFSDNASTKLQKLAASWTDLKVAIGDAANANGVFGKTIDALSASMEVFASRDLSFFEKLNAFLSGGGIGMSNAAVDAVLRQQDRIKQEQKEQEQVIREVDRAFKEFNGNIEAYGRAIETHVLREQLLAEFTKRLTQAQDDKVTTLKELQEAEKELNDLFQQTDITDQKKLQNTADQILSIREKIKAIEDLLKVEKESFSLSQTAQRAMAGASVNGVTDASGIGGLIPVDMDAIFQRMEALRNKTSEITTEVSDNFIDMSGVVAGAITNFASSLGEAIAGTGDFGDAILKTIGGFMESFGASLIALGIGKIALDAFSGPEMIAAGFALAAAGGAVSAATRNMGSDGVNAGAPGRLPSEVNVSGRSFVRGYTIETVLDKDSYRRSRVG